MYFVSLWFYGKEACPRPGVQCVSVKVSSHSELMPSCFSIMLHSCLRLSEWSALSEAATLRYMCEQDAAGLFTFHAISFNTVSRNNSYQRQRCSCHSFVTTIESWMNVINRAAMSSDSQLTMFVCDVWDDERAQFPNTMTRQIQTHMLTYTVSFTAVLLVLDCWLADIKLMTAYIGSLNYGYGC